VLPAALLDDRFERPCSIDNLLDGDMEEARFLVQGSAPSPCKVVFVKEDKNLTATCTCPAGQNGQYCKHRFATPIASCEWTIPASTICITIGILSARDIGRGLAVRILKDAGFSVDDYLKQ
jgi:hypothetical protein